MLNWQYSIFIFRHGCIFKKVNCEQIKISSFAGLNVQQCSNKLNSTYSPVSRTLPVTAASFVSIPSIFSTFSSSTSFILNGQLFIPKLQVTRQYAAFNTKAREKEAMIMQALQEMNLNIEITWIFTLMLDPPLAFFYSTGASLVHWRNNNLFHSSVLPMLPNGESPYSTQSPKMWINCIFY